MDKLIIEEIDAEYKKLQTECKKKHNTIREVIKTI